MFRLFSILLISFLCLHAVTDKELLSRAQGFSKSQSKSNQFRAYNDYKNLYLRALMSEDKTLRVSSLKGIVASGMKLHIDVIEYSKELSEIQPTSIKTLKTPKKIQIKSTHRLKSVRWNNGRLVLLFDKKLRNNQINYFTLYDKNTKKNKYIFDIHASMLTRSHNLRKDNIERIKLAQFNPNTLRLVIEDKDKLKIAFKKDNGSLIVNIITPKSSVQKRVIPLTVSPQRLDRNKVIVIDAGHGGKDPGAIGHKRYREKVIVLSIAKKLKKVLVARGFTVFMTRNSDKFIKLSNRTKFANRKNADLFISIHANAVGKKIAKQVHGIECFFLAKSRSARAKRVAAKENSSDLSEMDVYGKESFLSTLNSHNIVAANKLAIDLQRGALASLCRTYDQVKDAGVREGPFWVLVGAQMPAVLVEVGFITHPREAKRLVTPAYQKRMALGLANGVERYFLNN